MNGIITKIVYTLFVGQIIINDLDSCFPIQGNQFSRQPVYEHFWSKG